MTNTQHVINNLRAQRKKAGLRQLDVARFLGLGSIDRISRWEHGSAVPHIGNLFKLCVLYGASPEELYAEMFQAIQEQIRHPASEHKVTSNLHTVCDDCHAGTARSVGAGH